MNWLILSAVVALAALSAAEDQYTDRYDNINVEEIIANKKLLAAYVNCMLEKGRCTAEGRELKKHAQDAIQSSCAKCTEQQKQKARKVVNHIKNNEKTSWEQLKAKYDPGDKFKETYEAFLARDD